MSTKKRLLAICVSLLTIPAFTMGDAPYNIADITDQAYAITEKGHTSALESSYVVKEKAMSKIVKNAETTTECGTEKAEYETETTTTETTTATTTTTMTTTTAVTQTQAEAAVAEAAVAEAVMEVEVVNQVDPTEAVEPTTESETFVEETMAETFYDEEMTEEEETSTEVTGRDEFVWDGKRLNPVDGIVRSGDTPTGLKETFYNLNMFGCLDLMGLSYDGYDETEDGFKTYNGYIMVASPDLSRWSKGSYIETTNGMGIVVDFCPAGNLDIAVTW